jgi:ADP-ribosyl-[dinitrogen reductase] hydrolase
MVSDDTEHACLTAQAMIESRGDVEVFRRRLAAGLRWWFLRMPAGIGLSTLRAIIRLWMGVPAAESGVNSAGNGAAMRAPILGLIGDSALRRAMVRASTRITHADPRAEHGSQIIALAVWISGT